MKRFLTLLSKSCLLLLLLPFALPGQLALGVIDQNQMGTEGGYLERTFASSLGPVAVIFDFRRQVHQFTLLENGNSRVLFETRLDEFDNRIKGIFNHFVLLENRTSILPLTVTQVDLRTGERRDLYTSNNGHTFSIGAGSSGYAYLNPSRTLSVTDGTTGGTFEVAANTTDVEGFVFGNHTLLTSSEGIHITDGTPSGTRQLFTQAVENPQGPFSWNGQFFLPLPNGLIVTDGTEAGTRYLIEPGAGTFPTSFVANDEGIFFINADAASGKEVWRTDGTLAGTGVLQELIPGPEDGIAQSFTISAVDGQLIFKGGTTELNNKVYLARDTGLQVLIDLDPATVTRANYRALLMGVTEGGTLFLTTSHVEDRQTLWRVRPGEDPVELGEFEAFSINPSRVAVVGESLFYQGGTDPERLYLALSDGTSTTEVDFLGEYNGRWLVADDVLYYATDSSEEGEDFEERLYRVGPDGVVERYGVNSPSQNLVLPIFPYSGGIAAFANHPFSAEGFYLLDEVANPTFLTDLLPYNRGSNFDVISKAEEMLYVRYENGIYLVRPGTDRAELITESVNTSQTFFPVGNQLLFNPTQDSLGILGPEGVVTVAVPPNFRNIRSGYTLFEDAIYFLVHSSNSQNTRYHFVRIPLEDPAAMASVYSLVSEDPIPGTSFAAREIAVANGKMYLAYPTFENGWELGQSDGTPEGTVLYRDLVLGQTGSIPRTILGTDGRLLVRTRLEVGSGQTLYLELLGQNRFYWFSMAAFNDRPILLTGNATHTFVGLRITTSGDDGALIIDDASGISRQTVLNLNSPFFNLSDGRVAYHVSNDQLRITAGEESSDQTLDDINGSEPKTTALFGNYFLYVINEINRESVGVIDLVTEMRSEFSGIDGSEFLTFYPVSDRVYFPGSTRAEGQELLYLMETSLRPFVGRVFEDLNGNGTEDTVEPLVPGVLIEARGDYYTLTRSGEDGRFTLPLSANGNFTISVGGDGCFETTTSPENVTLTAEEQPTEDIVFGVRGVGNQGGISTNVTTATVRCGFTIPVWLTARNTGCVSLDVDFNFPLPDGVTYISADEPPTTVVGNDLHWRIGAIPAGADYRIRLLLEMPDESRVGEPVDFRFEAMGLYEFDLIVSDESVYAPTLRCAIDPNDKLVQPARPDSLNSNYTQVDEALTYTIRFQNTGNDTAINVRLEDQLAAELDWASFKPIAASHSYRVELSPAGLLNVFFDNILLPDSSANQEASNGFFAFEINPQPDALDVVVNNTAGIYFDFNEPVITNTTLNTVVEFLDEDEDGFFFWLECKDQDPNINPDAFDVGGNGIDENCDGEDAPVATQEPLTGLLEMFPNPVTDMLTIRYSQADELIIWLLDGRGRTMQKLTMHTAASISFKNYPPGVYFLSVWEAGSGRGKTHRIVR